MENATKALIIAAAILIAIVLISLGVFVLGQGTTLVKENSNLSENEVAALNSKFEAYFGTRVSGTKVKQLQNAVNQHNRTADDDKQINITAPTISAAETYTVQAADTNGYSNSGLLQNITVTQN